MIILGIDPGTATTGWAVVAKGTREIKLLSYGVITTGKDEESAQRLKKIYEEVIKIIKKYRIEEVSLEMIFFNTNAKTALDVGQASGVMKLAADKSKIPIFEYTPLQVKMALTGYGRAEKSQIGKMVQQTFKLKSVPKPDDAADAVAISLTHCFSRKMSRRGVGIPTEASGKIGL